MYIKNTVAGAHCKICLKAKRENDQRVGQQEKWNNGNSVSGPEWKIPSRFLIICKTSVPYCFNILNNIFRIMLLLDRHDLSWQKNKTQTTKIKFIWKTTPFFSLYSGVLWRWHLRNAIFMSHRSISSYS